MRKIILLIVFAFAFIRPVSALDVSIPEAPDVAEEYMPEDTESFGDGVWYIFKLVIGKIHPEIVEASGICLSVVAIVLICSLVHGFSDSTKRTTELIAAVMIGILLFRPSEILLQLGVDTVREMTDYGKLLLPVMTGTMAAQGGTTSSAALYSGTVLFSGLLSTAISNILVPLIYIYICFIVAGSAVGHEQLKEIQKFIKWLMTWILKIILYVFTGYMGITGIITGSVDSAAVKATKLTISGAVPVIGNIIADASETILVSAGVVKNGAGVYGMLAMIAILIGPFLQIGVQYLLLKFTGSVCAIFGVKSATNLVKDFSGAMGMILAMIGTMGLLLMVSIVCFMKGIG